MCHKWFLCCPPFIYVILDRGICRASVFRCVKALDFFHDDGSSVVCLIYLIIKYLCAVYNVYFF